MLKIIPQPKLIEYKEGLANSKVTYIKTDNIAQEGYIIDADVEGIKVSYSSDKGKFYGQQTVQHILRQTQYGIPSMHIEDAPKYKYRGFMIDCSRHFFEINALKKYIDIMADLKLNMFHWHLTDDQGWRIEIKKYPLLTEIGSKRYSTRNDGVEVAGYYTQVEIKEIVEYCAERFIEVIPEIDMPGHFTSAIASYPYLGCEEKKIAVSESFGIHADIACAGKESTYEFCENVLKEVFELFPSNYLHLGGDEALKLHWMNCPDCQKKMNETHLENEEQLQGYFMNRLVKFAESYNKSVINWNDGLCGGNMEGEVILQYWKESKLGKEVLKREVAKGRKVIMSPFFAYYVDYPYGMTSLKKTYNYEIAEDIQSAVIGLEATLWAEYVENTEKLEYMVFPRLIAVAERGWSENNHYKEFIIRLQEYYNYLDTLKINYAKVSNPGKLAGFMQLIRFFKNAYDKTNRENLKLQILNKKAHNKKYAKK